MRLRDLTLALGTLSLVFASGVPNRSLHAAEPSTPTQQTDSIDLEARDLRSRLQAAHAVRSKQTNLAAELEDREFEDYSDLEWDLQEAINRKESFAGLESVGVTQRDNGSVDFDLKKHPHWMSFHQWLGNLDDPRILGTYVPMLRERGFRDRDFDALYAYLKTNSLEKERFLAAKPLLHRFATSLTRGSGTMELEARTFQRQLQTAHDRAQHKWARGLLRALDGQRQRILTSLMRELVVLKTVTPDGDMQEWIAQARTVMGSPQYTEFLAAKEREYLR